MADQVYIGNFKKGQNNYFAAFNIDNDAFPTLYNFYSWRGRVKKKRGTSLLGRLQRQIKSVTNATPPTNFEASQLALVGGVRNLFQATISAATKATQAVLTVNGSIFLRGDFVKITGVVGMTQLNGNTYQVVSVTTTTIKINVDSSGFSNYVSGGIATLTDEFPSVVPKSVSFTVGANTYTEPATPDGTLIGSPAGTGTINYATGDVTITGGGTGPLTGTFSYYPGLPVMGLRDFSFSGSSLQYPVPLAFDTVYSYQLNQTSANNLFFYNVNFYKETETPFVWSGQDYQLFWTSNYQGALWATNNNPGLHFVTGTYVSGSTTTTVTFNFKSGGVNYTNLIVGDTVWFNEWNAGGNANINGVVGTVSDITGAASGNYVVTFTVAPTVSGTGIAQLLSASILGQDGIKWYDGDPTAGTGIPAATGLGWVNFAPPLTAATVSINDKTAGLYYLVGALAIVPFKDRLVFFSPWIQTSTGSPLQLTDTVIWSWNGTPYYNSITPANETFDVTAYYVDQTGKGGWLSAGIAQPITTVSTNEDALLVGFGGNGRKTRFVYTGDDLQPFLFFTINSELPSSSTFSSITLDRGAIDLGPYGIALTDQQSSQRIDVDIPDQVFTVRNLDSGVLRVNAIRDFQNEFIYFTYPLNDSPWKFPTRSFLFNYRDNTWAILYENYTAQGRFRQQVKNTWVSIGQKYGSWAGWRVPWNAPSSSALYANLIAGNPQGYVLIRDTGTAESVSGSIASIANDGSGMTQITSYNHCVQNQDPFLLTGDYLFFSNSIGNTFLNGKIGQVTRTIDANNFVVDITFQAGTYLGLGNFTRLCQPIMQTKQFNFYWQQGRQTRLCTQKYLLEKTSSGQVTIDIYLSQNDDNVWNMDPIVPNPDATNNALVFSQLLYTCPESTNLGLTPANINLQMPISTTAQKQIWHRMNTSLQGDSVQLGVTLNDAQMRDVTLATSEIILHAIQFTAAPGPILC